MIAKSKRTRIVRLPSGRGLMLERLETGIVCFAGPVDRQGVVIPDVTRRWLRRFGRTRRPWSEAQRRGLVR